MHRINALMSAEGEISKGPLTAHKIVVLVSDGLPNGFPFHLDIANELLLKNGIYQAY